MGRSQVLYNRTKGRYKNRGGHQHQDGARGGGGRDPVNPGRGPGPSSRHGPTATATPSPHSRNQLQQRHKSPSAQRNAFGPSPQPQPSTQRRRPKLDESVLLMDQPRIHASRFPTPYDDTAFSLLESGGSSVDVPSMAATLSTLALSRRLRVPPHISAALLQSQNLRHAHSEIAVAKSNDSAFVDDEASSIQSSHVASPRSASSPISPPHTKATIDAPQSKLSRASLPKHTEPAIKAQGDSSLHNSGSLTVRSYGTTAADRSFSIGDTRVRVLQNGQVEVREKPTLRIDTSSRTNGQIFSSGSESRIASEAKATATVPFDESSPTPLSQNRSKMMTSSMNGRSMLISDELSAKVQQSSVPPSESRGASSNSVALESLRTGISLTHANSSEETEDDNDNQNECSNQKKPHTIRLAAESFDRTSSQDDEDDRYRVDDEYDESDDYLVRSYRDSYDMEDVSSSFDTQENEPIESTLEKIQKVRDKITKIDEAYKRMEAEEEFGASDTSNDASQRSPEVKQSKKSKTGKETDAAFLEEWLDDAMKSKSKDDDESHLILLPLVGEDSTHVSSASVSTITRSTVTRSQRSIATKSQQDSRCWTVDSRGKLFESEEEKRTEDLDEWLDSVIN